MSQGELEEFLSKGYKCLWHMTSILPVILKRPGIQHIYNSLSINVEEAIKGSSDNYHLLAWETDEIPSEYKAVINNYNPETIFTPSEWNTNTVRKFFNAKTIPHLIEEKESSCEPVPLPVGYKDKFIILSVSEWTNRKNFEGLLKAFMTEFYDHDDVLLVIKTSAPPGVSKQDLVNKVKSVKDSIRTPKEKKQNIVFIMDYLSNEKMKFLFDESSVFCLPSFGEGFSLPLSEAVINKLPVICPRLGGHIDYLSEDNPFFIDGMWDTVFDQAPYDFDGNWYVPSIKSMREKLREAYEDFLSGGKLLSSTAAKNLEKISNGSFSRSEIGSSLLESISKKNPHQTKIQKLKRELQNKTIEQKVMLLKDSFKGDDCYILNCGPSLSDYNRDNLAEFLKDKLVLSVKQAYDLFSEVTDFHFFNCSNLPKREEIYAPHYKNSRDTITIASSNYDEYRRWSAVQTSDVFFKIPIRTEINNEFLVRTGKIDDFLLKSQVERPCGPGIMYETVLFTAIHLGVKSITCLGWDLTMDKVNENNYKHFYGSTEGLMNRGDILEWEIEETRNFSKTLYEWMLANNIELKLASKRSSLYDKIPRVHLEV